MRLRSSDGAIANANTEGLTVMLQARARAWVPFHETVRLPPRTKEVQQRLGGWADEKIETKTSTRLNSSNKNSQREDHFTWAVGDTLLLWVAKGKARTSVSSFSRIVPGMLGMLKKDPRAEVVTEGGKKSPPPWAAKIPRPMMIREIRGAGKEGDVALLIGYHADSPEGGPTDFLQEKLICRQYVAANWEILKRKEICKRCKVAYPDFVCPQRGLAPPQPEGTRHIGRSAPVSEQFQEVSRAWLEGQIRRKIGVLDIIRNVSIKKGSQPFSWLVLGDPRLERIKLLRLVPGRAGDCVREALKEGPDNEAYQKRVCRQCGGFYSSWKEKKAVWGEDPCSRLKEKVEAEDREAAEKARKREADQEKTERQAGETESPARGAVRGERSEEDPPQEDRESSGWVRAPE